MITARVEEIDRLLGLDDYICKQFSPREVVARVKAVLHRAHQPETDSALKVDESRYRAWLHGRPLELTPVGFRLLKTLSAALGDPAQLA